MHPTADGPTECADCGNVQRAVLARELTGDFEVLTVSNSCFGLDFAAVAAIPDQLVEARNRGVAIREQRGSG